MDAAQLQHLAVVLTHVNDATVDWAEVAKQRGVSRKDNALTAFKQMIKKYGIEYDNKKFRLKDDFDAIANGTPGVAAKPRNPRKRRSEDESDGTKEEDASPTKRRKVKKAAELINKGG